MLNSLRNILVMIVIASFFSFAWGAENKPGGEGFMQNERQTFYSGAESKCFDVEKGTVASVCAKYRINWKLWSLMGEPVGDYNLSWSLTSITLRNPVGVRVQYNSVDSLPKQLQKSARAIELHIYGAASTNNSVLAAYHGFETGTEVRADVGNSMNVPSSPSWNTLFLKRPECDIEKQEYMNTNDAKLEFKKGINLQNLIICPKSSVSVSSLESTIKELCKSPGAEKTYHFCPEQKINKEKAVEVNAIEDAFDQLEEKAAETAVSKAGNIEDAFDQLEASQIEKQKEKERLQAMAIEEKAAEEAKEAENKSYREREGFRLGPILTRTCRPSPCE